jgi:hypothetical protein
MIKLRVAFRDGTVAECEYFKHEVEEIELMIEGTPKELLTRVELEDTNKETLIYQYKKDTDYVY